MTVQTSIGRLVYLYGFRRIEGQAVHHDGQPLGLPGMINPLVRAADVDLAAQLATSPTPVASATRTERT